MNAFNLNLEKTVMRLYLMMLVVIIGGFTGFWALAYLAFPIFLSALLGVEFSRRNLAVQSKSLAHKVSSRMGHRRASAVTAHD